tara:strand:- start:2190 stop:3251 length:1062 start_codon:yes stop_codon:yes gene_type:complete
VNASVRLVAVGRRIDGKGDFDTLERYVGRLQSEIGITPRALTIDPLSADWHSDLAKDHFRSGCAPIEAVCTAKQLILSGEEGAVLIRGKDLLRTGYTSSERREAMAIFDSEVPLMESYDQLASVFARQQGVSGASFIALRDALFENYWRTFSSCSLGAKRPAASWFNAVTPLFRGVDCANPVVDFEGAVLLVSQSVCRDMQLVDDVGVAVVAAESVTLEQDGPEAIEAIASYQHLKAVSNRLISEGLAPLSDLFERGQLKLDLYTCFPVVPLACLLATGIVDSADKLEAFLKHHPITQTGGMNLARAAWNNPALNGLISMFESLQQEPSATRSFGLVHGNGGLGYKQGLVLLG